MDEVQLICDLIIVGCICVLVALFVGFYCGYKAGKKKRYDDFLNP